MREYIFTFGYDHKHPDSGRRMGNCYVVIKAESSTDARAKMMEKFGTQWAFQYTSRALAGVNKYHLTEIELNDRILRVVK